MSATASHGTVMSASKNLSKSPSRRVLGDLTPKAINTPTKQPYEADPTRFHSPLKQVQTLSPQLFKGAENMPPVGTFKVGRKRSIYEVDGVANVEYAGHMYGGGAEGLSRRAPVTAAALREHTVCDIDPTPGSPTEVATPSNHEDDDDDDAPVEISGNSQDTQASAGSFSFSRYINDDAFSSQPAVEFQKEPVAEPEKKKSKLELLRLSLGIGMYKIRTNQVSKRGKDIISNWEITSSMNSSMDASTSVALTTSVDSTTSQSVPSITVSKPETFKSVSANLDPGRPIGKLTLGPILLPTAVSSRIIYDHPSSPPTLISPNQLMSPIRAASNYGAPVPMKSRVVDEDYEDEEGEDMEMADTAGEQLHRIRGQRFEEGDMSSLAVKGHAAKGLLELMTSRR